MEKGSIRLGIMVDTKLKQIPPEFKEVEKLSKDGFVTIASNTLIN